MNLYLTRGMFGECIQTLLECALKDEILKFIDDWKSANINKDSFKIERYNRFTSKDGKIAIDFGDYCYFFLVENMNLKDVDSLMCK